MCLLTYFPEGKQPNAAALKEASRTNRDGFGYAIVIPEERRILVNKSMDFESMLKAFLADRLFYPNGPALFHHRLATDGVTDTYNVHPFPINNDKRTVMAHNGIFSQCRPGKDDHRSDTRIVAQSFARHFKLRSARGRRKFGGWMGKYNKVVILTVDPSYGKHGFIINEDQGIWDGGIWYSNSSYVAWVPRVSHGGWNYYSDGYTSTHEGEHGSWYKDSTSGVWKWKSRYASSTQSADDARKTWTDCGMCEKTFCVNPTVYRCVLCTTCQMCYEGEAHCACWLSDMNDVASGATVIGGSTTSDHLSDEDFDRIIADFEQKQGAEKSKALVPLGAKVSDALSQAHKWAREHHHMGCACEWCVINTDDDIN